MGKILPFLSLGLSCLMAADLPIREVILYKHGVGYFERRGDLPAGESARLEFKAAEMNDVLKSLTVQDSSGKVTGLRYDSSDPLEHRLGQFPFYAPSDAAPPSLASLLNRMQGARLEVRFGTETLHGNILSARVVPGDEKRPERQEFVLALDSGDIRSLDLSSATAVKLEDPSLQRQLRDYIRVLSSSHSDEKRSVYIDSSDTAARQVHASYMIPTPVWKSSYRLIFKDAAQPTLEGWAIVDNTTGEDWTNVKLALVSGRPISFISRLYEPKYIERSYADLPDDRSVGPVVYAGSGLGSASARDALADEKAAAKPRQLMRAQNAPAAPAMMESVNVAGSMSSADIRTAGRELGDLFEYSFTSGVTVKKGESAMLPFLQEPLSVRKLLIYSDLGAQHPMNAAEIKNTTNKTLDGGPITVFDANSYAGEALVETLKTGDKRLISYAVDLGTLIGTKVDSDRAAIRELHARRGVLTARYAVRETRTYSIRNVDPKAKTLIIEEPIRYGYKNLNQTPSETTPNTWRFEVKVPPAASTSFPITQEREYDNVTQIVSVTPNVLVDYLQNVKLSDNARRQLQAIAAKKGQIAETDTAIKDNEARVARLFTDQERLRQNIGSLNNVSGQQEQVQKYAKTLSDQEALLVKLRDDGDQLRTRKASLETELNSLMDNMDF